MPLTLIFDSAPVWASDTGKGTTIEKSKKPKKIFRFKTQNGPWGLQTQLFFFFAHFSFIILVFVSRKRKETMFLWKAVTGYFYGCTKEIKKPVLNIDNPLHEELLKVSWVLCSGE